MADVLELRDLSLAYGAALVLDSVNLTVAEGELLALLGPSGSGKSTLLNAVAGFLPLRSGEIFLRQRRVATASSAEPPEKREIALVFQDYGLWPHLTALDTVAYPLRRRGVRRDLARSEAQQLLDRLGVGQPANKKTAQLSGGEQQRVGLARSMARKAALYLDAKCIRFLLSRTKVLVDSILVAQVVGDHFVHVDELERGERFQEVEVLDW